MEKQRVLRKAYMNRLIADIKSGDSISLFRNREIQLTKESTLIMPHIEKPISIISKMDPENGFESAIALYEAYDKLTPLEAADPRFWNYLAIQDLYPYLIERWPAVYERKTEINETNYILEHYLLEGTGQLMRCWLSGLWWSVHLSIDYSSEDKYKLTEVLFWNETLRTRTMGTYMLARKKELALGFLDYCYEKGKDNFGNFENEHQLVTSYLNKLGGAKALTFYHRREIKSILSETFPVEKEVKPF